MSHAELVDRVGVRRGEVGNHHVGIEQLFVHWLIDHRRMDDLVGANARQARFPVRPAR